MVYIVSMGALFLGAAALLTAQGSISALPVGVAGVAGTAWFALVWARSRTEIGPEGIANRTVRAEEFIPWPEVVRVVPLTATGTVLVVRLGGGVTRLAGLRGRSPRDGIGVGQVIDLIEARIGEREDSSTRPVPPMITRRLQPAPTRALLLGLAAFGVLAGLYAVVHPVVALAAAFFLGLAAFMFVATRRALTEVGPDGIRNRALGRTVFVPWSDVTDVVVSGTPSRTVRVMRREGGRMTLAAVRDSDVHADGLGLDDVADVVRGRAAAATPAPVRLPRPRPLTLRPSRRPLWWIAAAVPAAVALAVFSAYSTALVMIFIVSAVMSVRLAFHLVFGRTSATPDGLRNRLGRTTAVVAWEDVEEFVVVPTLFGWIVRVTRPPHRPLTLAAPRDGLLGRDASMESSLAVMRALAADTGRTPPPVRTLSPGLRLVWWALPVLMLAVGCVIGKPWLEPWWPTTHEATRLPSACGFLSGGSPLVPQGHLRGSEWRDYRPEADSDCTLTGETGDLDLDLVLYRRVRGRSGTRQAALRYAEKRSDTSAHPRPVPVPGLGDDAWETALTSDGRTTAKISVRRHNVWFEVSYSGELPARTAIGELQALARTVVPRVHDGRWAF